MAMSTRKKVVGKKTSASEALPSMLASLGLLKKPDFKDLDDQGIYRIHRAIRVLKYAGYEPAVGYDFDGYYDGPVSSALSEALRAMDWRQVASAMPIHDSRIAATHDAMSKGDDFLLALAIAVGVVDRNRGISKEETIWMIGQIRPELSAMAEEAYGFAEARIWPR
jgi:hypothetical protein